MKHCMIDLETLSTNNDAACIAIGAVGFDAETIFSKFEVLIDPMAVPGHRSASTLAWWDQQNKTTRDRMFSGKTNPMTAYGQWCTWCENNDLKFIWGNDPQFDVSILRALGSHYNTIKFPFHFRNERSFRTWTWLAKIQGITYSEAYEGNEAHDALSDAVAQARAVQLIAKKLGIKI